MSSLILLHMQARERSGNLRNRLGNVFISFLGSSWHCL
uniref:Uncharacterized protein n=1 Tax=Arundo donax TaxID=35708 RepID=A0A0A9A9T2_ARUDO